MRLKVAPKSRYIENRLQPLRGARLYHFNVWTTKKLRYMHRNGVKLGLVGSPKQWCSSSYRFYLLGEPGIVKGMKAGEEFLFEKR